MTENSAEILSLVSEAQEAMSGQRWHDAALIWSKTIERAPENVQARIQKGNCLIQLADYKSAEEVFTKVKLQWPELPAGYLGLATVSLKNQKQRLGLQYLFQTLEKFPENKNARLLLCQLFMRFKQYEIAREFIFEPGVFEPDTSEIKSLLEKLDLDHCQFYNQDGLASVHNHEFMNLDKFKTAYERGMVASNHVDYNWHWRVHIGLWAAKCASSLQGDFVECGVNMGFLSSAIMTYLDWNTIDKQFFLLDTFKGIDENYISENEIKLGIVSKNRTKLEQGSYTDSYSQVKKNFEEWKNVRIIKGSVPETLEEVTAKKISFLHLDMNSTIPEQAALEFFWDRLEKGALVLMDDYAYRGFIEQKKGMDKVAKNRQREIVSLPTGQGLLIK